MHQYIQQFELCNGRIHTQVIVDRSLKTSPIPILVAVQFNIFDLFLNQAPQVMGIFLSLQKSVCFVNVRRLYA
jgi:hypothetical protein